MTEHLSTILTSLPVPVLSPAQLSLFDKNIIEQRPMGRFRSDVAREKLSQLEGEQVWGIDIGGNKIIAIPYRVHGARLVPDDKNIHLMTHTDGEGCLDFLEELSRTTSTQHLPVGISYAGIVEDMRPRGGPHVPDLIDDLTERYGGDFRGVFPTFQHLMNDAVAGVVTSLHIATQSQPNLQSCILIVNGSGLGAALVRDGSITATEVGHTHLAPELAKEYGIELGPTERKSIEVVAASRAGIERRWFEQTKVSLDGIAIRNELAAQNPLALKLYEESTTLTAYAVEGLREIFDISPESNFLIAYHGGTFHVPGYEARVTQILSTHLRRPLNTLNTQHASSNICAHGAALAALIPEALDNN